jgi:hypothetical protein
MTTPKSEFEKWFVAQHGKRTELKGKFTDEELKELERDGERARAELIYRHLWDEKYQSALYAWQAKK